MWKAKFQVDCTPKAIWGLDYAYTMVHKAAQRTATTHESIAPVHAPVIEN